MTEIAPPYQAHSETSREAADRVDAAALREKVLSIFKREDRAGVLDDDIAAEFERANSRHSEGTLRARRWELLQAGIIRDSGRTRKTRRGRNATVWVLVNPPRPGQLELGV